MLKTLDFLGKWFQANHGICAMYVAIMFPPLYLSSLVGSIPNVSVSPAGSAKAPQNAGNDDIKKLQEALKSKGFFKGEITGEAGKETDDAVKAFKVANKLKEDAIVGPKVKELLGLK